MEPENLLWGDLTRSYETILSSCVHRDVDVLGEVCSRLLAGTKQRERDRGRVPVLHAPHRPVRLSQPAHPAGGGTKFAEEFSVLMEVLSWQREEESSLLTLLDYDLHLHLQIRLGPHSLTYISTQHRDYESSTYTTSVDTETTYTTTNTNIITSSTTTTSPPKPTTTSSNTTTHHTQQPSTLTSLAVTRARSTLLALICAFDPPPGSRWAICTTGGGTGCPWGVGGGLALYVDCSLVERVHWPYRGQGISTEGLVILGGILESFEDPV
ncbi:unnamed protein product [Boreogadus saida]